MDRSPPGLLAPNRLRKTISAQQNFDGLHAWASPVSLVHLVYLVDLVCFVYLVHLVQPNKRDRPNKPDRPNNGLLTLADFFSILLSTVF